MNLSEGLSKLSIDNQKDVLTEYGIKVEDLEAYKRNPIKELYVIKDFPILSNLDKKTRPVVAKYQNNNEGYIFIPFDEYFKLLDDTLWNNPQFGKNYNEVTMEKRMADAQPYNVFYNSLRYEPETHRQLFSVQFTDLLCPSLGNLKSSLHLTHKADIEFIISQFAERRCHKIPMTIIHGYERFAWPKNSTMLELFPALKVETVIPSSGGRHHTKISVFMYDDDSIRIVIGSADLYREDWQINNQQLWISPRCEKLPEGSSKHDGESVTGFKKDLINYMHLYESLSEWINIFENTDFRSIKVVLLYTRPKSHSKKTTGIKNGNLHYIRKVLSDHCTIPAPESEHHKWAIVSQTPSLGSTDDGSRFASETFDIDWFYCLLVDFFSGLLGVHQSEWLDEVLKTLSSSKSRSCTDGVQFRFIYPTMKNSRDSHLGILGSYCCTYEKVVKYKQNAWLAKHQCQWKADNKKRSKAMPHTKCYLRVSPDQKKMVYFFLTTANLSRAAWGKERANRFVIASYEIGILFIPEFFDEEYFEIQNVQNQKNQKMFPLIFDIPLKLYGKEDHALCIEESWKKKPWNQLEHAWEFHENIYYEGRFNRKTRFNPMRGINK